MAHRCKSPCGACLKRAANAFYEGVAMAAVWRVVGVFVVCAGCAPTIRCGDEAVEVWWWEAGDGASGWADDDGLKRGSLIP